MGHDSCGINGLAVNSNANHLTKKECAKRANWQALESYTRISPLPPKGYVLGLVALHSPLLGPLIVMKVFSNRNYEQHNANSVTAKGL